MIGVFDRVAFATQREVFAGERVPFRGGEATARSRTLPYPGRWPSWPDSVLPLSEGAEVFEPELYGVRPPEARLW